MIEPLLELVRGHPQRAMLAAHHIWETTPAGETAGDEQWTEALERALDELQETFERYWERLSSNECRVASAACWTGLREAATRSTHDARSTASVSQRPQLTT